MNCLFSVRHFFEEETGGGERETEALEKSTIHHMDIADKNSKLYC